MSTRDNILVPVSEDDLAVLSWYAAWTPAVHERAWKARRRWLPGFRAMEDTSTAYTGGKDLEKAIAEDSYPPALGGETIRRTRARNSLEKLLSYQLLEGCAWTACRLTPRGRAALLLNGRTCPAFFESHCPEVFDDCDLLPALGTNTKVDFDDTVMSRLPETYRGKHGMALPDDATTWALMLEEYKEDDYRASGSLRGASAHLASAATTGRYLNGSLRAHNSFISLTIEDESNHVVVQAALSLEGLADLLTGNHSVPITLDRYNGHDGMARSLPAPPPVSVSRRMKERISRHGQDLQTKLEELTQMVAGSKTLGKRAQEEMVKLIGLVERDTKSQGAFAAQQAMEEMSSVAESMLGLLRDKAALAGVDAGLLLGEPVVPVRQITDGSEE